MSDVVFSKEEKVILVEKIQRYLRDELDLEVGGFDAEFLLDFFSREMGAYFYSRGLYDARAVMESRMEMISEAIYEIEKPTEFGK